MMATPTLSATMGESSRQATMVRVTDAPNAARGVGRGRSAGQASRTSVAFSAERARISPASSSANVGPGLLVAEQPAQVVEHG